MLFGILGFMFLVRQAELKWCDFFFFLRERDGRVMVRHS